MPTTTKDHICKKCGKGFPRKAYLKTHANRAIVNGICDTRRKNTTEKVKPENKCDICEKNFTVKKSLDQHIKSFHEKIKDQICEKCGKGFSRKAYLKTHTSRTICDGRKSENLTDKLQEAYERCAQKKIY